MSQLPRILTTELVHKRRRLHPPRGNLLALPAQNASDEPTLWPGMHAELPRRACRWPRDVRHRAQDVRGAARGARAVLPGVEERVDADRGAGRRGRAAIGADGRQRERDWDG